MNPTAPSKVVLIGAGLGSLAAAVGLATAGFDVEIFEKNDKIGGKLNHVSQDGFHFDLGPSILILPQIFRSVFEGAGRRMEDYVRLVELQPQWRSFWEDGVVLDLHSDMARMEAELAKLPSGSDGYWAFIERSRQLWRYSERAYLNPGSDDLWDVLRASSPLDALRSSGAVSTMADGIARYVKEPHLRDMLGFFIKYVGSSCYDAPDTLNLLPYSQLGYGLFYVEGGMYNLARAYSRLLEELGVRVHLGAEVRRITTEAARVTGLELGDGTTVKADVVVSNMEVIPAYRELLGESGPMMKRYEKRFEPAASGLVVHLGLDRTYPELQHHNFFFSKDQHNFLDTIHRRHELPDDPTLYVVRPTATNPDLAPPGGEVLKILPHLPPIQDKPFTPADYLALEERVLDKLERMGLADLRAHIVTRHVLTPNDIQRLYYSNRGSIYGVVSKRNRNMAFKAPKQSERFPNLFFVGGSVNPGGGTPMVTLGGQQVAKAVERFLTG